MTVHLPAIDLPDVEIRETAYTVSCGQTSVHVAEALNGQSWWAGKTQHPTRVDALHAAGIEARRGEHRRRLHAAVDAYLDGLHDGAGQ